MISKRTGKAEAPERVAETQSRGEKSQELPFGADVRAATFGRTKSEDHALMERVMDLSNIRLAYRRVVGNKGAPGIDEVTVAELHGWLRVNWSSVRVALLEGRYMPQAVRAVDIPKPSGGERTIGISCSDD